MTDSQLDTVYTTLCHTMTRLGEQQAPLFLARLALLAIVRLDAPEATLALIDDAARDLAEPSA